MTGVGEQLGAEFVAGGTDRELLHGLIQYGVMAPSSHNTQPWRFRLVGRHLEVRVDQDRILPVSDPLGREVRIACGAAIGNMEIAARHFGQKVKTVLLPDRLDPELLARLSLAGSVEPTEEDHRLFQAIPHRHTVRKLFDPIPLPPTLKRHLQRAAAAQDAWLEFIDDEVEKVQLSGLILKADNMQFSDPEFLRELEQWGKPAILTHWIGGLDRYEPGLCSRMANPFEARDRRAAWQEALLSASPGLAILGTAEDLGQSWLKAGRALSSILLLATDRGVRASFLNQPLEVGVLRSLVGELHVNQGFPQLILRLGYGPEGHPAPRRAVTESVE